MMLLFFVWDTDASDKRGIEIYVAGEKISSMDTYRINRLKRIVQLSINSSASQDEFYDVLWQQLIENNVKEYSDREVFEAIGSLRWPNKFQSGGKELFYAIEMAIMYNESKSTSTMSPLEIHPSKIKSIDISSQKQESVIP